MIMTSASTTSIMIPQQLQYIFRPDSTEVVNLLTADIKHSMIS